MQNILWYCRQFILLMKPGIVLGNLLPLIAGFFLADGKDLSVLFLVAIGGSGIIACGCVINNYIDTDIDTVMERTKNRPLPLGNIKPKTALLFGILLGIISAAILWFFVGRLACALSIVGLFFYIVVYTILTKRNTVYAVHIGSIAGAVPPLIGYCAVKSPDMQAFLLFLSVAIWQVPHSFAIHVFRFQDYANAKIKTVPNTRGVKYTAKSMLCYIGFYIIVVAGFLFYSRIHFVLAGCVMVACVFWLKTTLDFYNKQEIKDVRMSFGASIINMTALSFVIIGDKIIF
jgi:protoheme IX farnesyltransferase